MAETSYLTDSPFLVTGGAGFIGFHVAQTLLSQGAMVVGLDNYNDYYAPALKHDRDRELIKHDNGPWSFSQIFAFDPLMVVGGICFSHPFHQVL